jgi:hypothetical protein
VDRWQNSGGKKGSTTSSDGNLRCRYGTVLNRNAGTSYKYVELSFDADCPLELSAELRQRVLFQIAPPDDSRPIRPVKPEQPRPSRVQSNPGKQKSLEIPAVHGDLLTSECWTDDDKLWQVSPEKAHKAASKRPVVPHVRKQKKAAAAFKASEKTVPPAWQAPELPRVQENPPIFVPAAAPAAAVVRSHPIHMVRLWPDIIELNLNNWHNQTLSSDPETTHQDLSCVPLQLHSDSDQLEMIFLGKMLDRSSKFSKIRKDKWVNRGGKRANIAWPIGWLIKRKGVANGDVLLRRAGKILQADDQLPVLRYHEYLVTRDGVKMSQSLIHVNPTKELVPTKAGTMLVQHQAGDTDATWPRVRAPENVYRNPVVQRPRAIKRASAAAESIESQLEAAGYTDMRSEGEAVDFAFNPSSQDSQYMSGHVRDSAGLVFLAAPGMRKSSRKRKRKRVKPVDLGPAVASQQNFLIGGRDEDDSPWKIAKSQVKLEPGDYGLRFSPKSASSSISPKSFLAGAADLSGRAGEYRHVGGAFSAGGEHPGGATNIFFAASSDTYEHYLHSGEDYEDADYAYDAYESVGPYEIDQSAADADARCAHPVARKTAFCVWCVGLYRSSVSHNGATQWRIELGGHRLPTPTPANACLAGATNRHRGKPTRWKPVVERNRYMDGQDRASSMCPDPLTKRR